MDDPEVTAEPIPPWSIARTAAYSLLVAIVFVAVQMAAMFIVLVVQLINEPELNVEQWIDQVESDGAVLSILTISTAMICIPFVTFLIGRREAEPWIFLQLKPVGARSTAIWLLALVAFVVLSDLLNLAIGRPVVPEFMLDAYSSAHPALLFIALVFAAPAFEEILFRGFVPGALESGGVSPISAAVVSSLAWSAIHTQYELYDIATIFVLGLLLAAARAKTGSLVPCLAMHSLANVIAFSEAFFAARSPVV